MVIDPELIPIIEEMMYEFMDIKLQSGKDWGSHDREATYHRSPITVNPEWYREMCKDFPRGIQPSQPKIKSKKQRTIVKRKYILEVFKVLIKNHKSDSKYASYIIGEAERRLESYQSEDIPFKDQF